MSSSAHDAYLESKILSADPVELVRILYRIAIDRLREARTHLAAGNILGRCRAIARASDALAELSCSLDHRIGGEISRRLAALYEYMQARLIEANCKQQEAPLREVLGLLTTLLEAWQNVKVERPHHHTDSTAAGLAQLAAHTRPDAAAPGFQGATQESAPGYAPRSWSV